MQQFKRLNDLVGWGLFVLAAVVYGLTVEPTASYWDVGEFIAASYKLEVPHPPGAPFFLLVGRMFSLFAGGNVELVAICVNFMSVISSAFTILFLYWSIVLLARKMIKAPLGGETSLQSMQMIGSGIIGALAYTFSDTFWFSAVEAEVYAMSSFFMAIVVWAMLKWELIEDPRLANRWLILIAYIMGLSIGVHLLNLVAIPALALLYYYKRYPKASLTGVALAMLLGLVIVGVIMVGIIPGLPSMAGSFEIFFVNSLGMPFGSGAIFFVLLMLGLLIFGVVYSERKALVGLNTILLSLVFILIGYSSYTLVVIRSNYNPPIDENNPENLIAFVSYLKREQYGDRPLVYGQYFDAELESYDRGAPVYRKGESKYEIASYKPVPVYSRNSRMTIMPRAYSTQPQHQQLYRERMGLQPHESPGFGDNLYYMFDYQMGHMYWRYFLWNFVGRKGDYKDAGVLTPFNASGDLPPQLENNKARNNYWMLPLILGLIGAFYQYSKDQRGFAFVLLLFFLSGLALILYLNSPPIEPRERDYIYVGSFYAFAMWIGLGVLAVAELFIKAFKRERFAAPALATGICLLVPGIMAAEGWDDHDRSDRYFSVDSAKNFLSSLAPNAILFTGGDNDTFPLWYAQEVEGFRTDVRVIVLTYFNTDWYIDQMKMKMNDSEPLPLSLNKENYKQGGLNDVVYYYENKNLRGALPLEQYIKLVRDQHPAIRLATPSDEVNTIPSRTLSLSIDTQKMLDSGIIPQDKQDLLVDKMEFKMTGNALEKKDLMLLDLLVTNNWERPVYFNNTSLQSLSFDLSQYIVHEGTTYRLLPIRNPNPQAELVNTDVMYDNMMNKFFWRELDNPDVYYTEDYRNFVLNHRASFNTLAGALLDEGDKDRALKVLHKSLEVMPDEGIPYDYASALTSQLLLEAGDTERAIQIADTLASRADALLAYLESENLDFSNQRQINLVILNQLSRSMDAAGRTEEANRYQQLLAKHYQMMQRPR